MPFVPLWRNNIKTKVMDNKKAERIQKTYDNVRVVVLIVLLLAFFVSLYIRGGNL